MTDATEDSIRKLVADGMVEIVGKDEHGHDVYRLTATGKQRAEELIGHIIALGEFDN
jgi:DNA-binding PadR family transcriptional regulator